MRRPMRILCLCTGNTCRSPMLAILLQRALEGQDLAATVESAGVAASPGDPASSGALTAMLDEGLDLREHRSRPLVAVDMASYDLVLAMGPHHAATAVAAGADELRVAVVDAEAGGVPDPYGGGLEDYRATAAVLKAFAEDLALRLAARRDRSS